MVSFSLLGKLVMKKLWYKLLIDTLEIGDIDNIGLWICSINVVGLHEISGLVPVVRLCFFVGSYTCGVWLCFWWRGMVSDWLASGVLHIVVIVKDDVALTGVTGAHMSWDGKWLWRTGRCGVLVTSWLWARTLRGSQPSREWSMITVLEYLIMELHHDRLIKCFRILLNCCGDCFILL